MNDESIKEAQQLCKDLEYLCSQDDTILEALIDEQHMPKATIGLLCALNLTKLLMPEWTFQTTGDPVFGLVRRLILSSRITWTLYRITLEG